MIVADASLLAHLLIPGSESPLAASVLARDPQWSAPLLWKYELRSVLLKHARAGNFSVNIAQSLMTRALAAMPRIEEEASSQHVIRAAMEFKISSYDAEYVALALSLRVPLVTFDVKLSRAASGIAILPSDFLMNTRINHESY